MSCGPPRRVSLLPLIRATETVCTKPGIRSRVARNEDWTTSVFPLITREMVFTYPDDVFRILNGTYKKCPSSSAAASIFMFYRRALREYGAYPGVVARITRYSVEFTESNKESGTPRTMLECMAETQWYRSRYGPEKGYVPPEVLRCWI